MRFLPLLSIYEIECYLFICARLYFGVCVYDFFFYFSAFLLIFMRNVSRKNVLFLFATYSFLMVCSLFRSFFRFFHLFSRDEWWKIFIYTLWFYAILRLHQTTFPLLKKMRQESLAATTTPALVVNATTAIVVTVPEQNKEKNNKSFGIHIWWRARWPRAKGKRKRK